MPHTVTPYIVYIAVFCVLMGSLLHCIGRCAHHITRTTQCYEPNKHDCLYSHCLLCFCCCWLCRSIGHFLHRFNSTSF